jgi:hypothetical protein
MPAQSVHLLANADHPGLSPWFILNENGVEAAPWVFTADRLRRF